jgi:hypothetical protein
MMQTSLMRPQDAVDFLIKKHQSIPAVEPNQKIIPLVGATGAFYYNIAKDEITCDEVNRLISGLAKSVYTFDNVLDLVDYKSKTRLEEESLGYKGNKKVVKSSEILLNNGNVVTATYNMIFDEGSLVGIKGQTQLVKVA